MSALGLGRVTNPASETVRVRKSRDVRNRGQCSIESETDRAISAANLGRALVKEVRRPHTRLHRAERVLDGLGKPRASLENAVNSE
jgi:hypothetical protein